MQCRRCGKDLGNSARCEFCGFDNSEGKVREMSNLEKNFYDGVTIDTGEENNSNDNRGNNYRFSRRTIYIAEDSNFFSRLLGKLFRGLLNNSLLAKIAVTLIVVALAALMFFVALPVLFLFLAAGVALLVFAKLGR